MRVVRELTRRECFDVMRAANEQAVPFKTLSAPAEYDKDRKYQVGGVSILAVQAAPGIAKVVWFIGTLAGLAGGNVLLGEEWGSI